MKVCCGEIIAATATRNVDAESKFSAGLATAMRLLKSTVLISAWSLQANTDKTKSDSGTDRRRRTSRREAVCLPAIWLCLV